MASLALLTWDSDGFLCGTRWKFFPSGVVVIWGPVVAHWGELGGVVVVI